MPNSPKVAFGKLFLPFVAKLIALCDDPPREAVDKILVLKSKKRKLLILFFCWSCTSFSLFFVVSEPVLALRALPALMPVKQSVGKERKSTNAELRSMAVTKFVRELPVKILSQLYHFAHE